VNEEQVIALLQLQAAQTSLHLEMRDLMREILDTMRLFVQQAVDEEPFAECQHPEASRVDLSTWNDPHHWVCRDCRYDSKSVA
jgi:hypothetical protein